MELEVRRIKDHLGVLYQLGNGCETRGKVSRLRGFSRFFCVPSQQLLMMVWFYSNTVSLSFFL